MVLSDAASCLVNTVTLRIQTAKTILTHHSQRHLHMEVALRQLIPVYIVSPSLLAEFGIVNRVEENEFSNDQYRRYGMSNYFRFKEI